MKKILFASGSKKNIDALAGIPELREEEYHAVTRAEEAGRRMESGEYSMLVINTPLEDSQGLSLSAYVAETLMYPVLLITSGAAFGQIEKEASARGIALLARPVEKKTYLSAFAALRSSAGVADRLRENNEQLRADLEEFRLVNRAKAYLIRNMGMTESAAHRFIEKQAMDLRITKGEVAQNILKTYFNK